MKPLLLRLLLVIEFANYSLLPVFRQPLSTPGYENMIGIISIIIMIIITCSIIMIMFIFITTISITIVSSILCRLREDDRHAPEVHGIEAPLDAHGADIYLSI